MRLSIDTSILVSALRNRQGASNLIMQYLQEQRFQALASTALFLEYESVLNRSGNLQAMKLSSGQVAEILYDLAASSGQSQFTIVGVLS